MTSPDFVSADGSPLAVYLALPAGDAPMLVHRAIRPESTILELGSGPGRLTRALVALGHDVTAVDDSPEMLAHVTGADCVAADAFELDLGRTFDVVLAASTLINRPGAEHRARLLEVASRHLRDGGSFIVERFEPGWLLSATDTAEECGPVRMVFEAGAVTGSVRSAAMTYHLGGRSWRQEFDAEDLPDAVLEAEAAAVGLVVTRHLDDAGSWVGLTHR